MIKTTLIDSMGSDLSVVNAARVSFGKKSDWIMQEVDAELKVFKRALSLKDINLIKYLASNKHYSPFGHCFLSFHVKAPIFVARQLVKHKFLRWNEISRRYVDDEPEFYIPEVWRGKTEDKKQGSEGEVSLDDFDFYGNTLRESVWSIKDRLHELLEEERDTYISFLKAGVAPEQARMILPQSTMTEWYWSGSLDAFADMCNLRCKEDTQYESRLVANQIDNEVEKLFPHSWKALRSK